MSDTKDTENENSENENSEDVQLVFWGGVLVGTSLADLDPLDSDKWKP